MSQRHNNCSDCQNLKQRYAIVISKLNYYTHCNHAIRKIIKEIDRFGCFNCMDRTLNKGIHPLERHMHIDGFEILLLEKERGIVP